MEESKLAQLMATMPQIGEVMWIGLRPERRAPMVSVEQVKAIPGEGLEGDRFSGTINSKRQVTLIQEEHLNAVASIMRKEHIDPDLTRRNIVVKGINLIALKDHKFKIGEAVFETTGACHPCSRMEENLGPGGYNAMRSHGGITAKVIREGLIELGDSVSLIK